jgi:septal ring factor EnvC (AmiA/AmiB activator)
MLGEAIMKNPIIIGALVALSIGALCVISSARAQVAPTPAPMEGGSQIANDIATHWASLMTSQQDFAKTVDAMMKDYAKVSIELRQTKAELADAQKQIDALKPKLPVQSPSPTPTPTPSTSAK